MGCTSDAFGRFHGCAGGAVFILNALGSIFDCSFTENDADCDGGALTILDGEFTVSGCTMDRNLAEDTGGAVMIDNSSVSFTDGN